MKILFPIHLNGENRGCEAIAMSTAKILGFRKENLIAYCDNINGATRLGLDKFYTLVPFRPLSLLDKMERTFYSFLVKDINKQNNFIYAKQYDSFLNIGVVGDIMLSTGGDMFCYSNNQVNYTVEYAKHKGLKTVLWGCSIGKNNLTNEKIRALHKFDIITVRESITQKLLTKELGLPNVYKFPDPAFVLEPQEFVLPDFFELGSVIGVNLSNFVGLDVSEGSVLYNALFNLVRTLLNETDSSILFIPHVIRKGQDDRIICSLLNEKLKKTGRTFLLNTEDYNYCQLRYIISRCRLFIGARTHSVISAYSTLVPTMALGYSVKSIGIAKDLGLDENSVVDCTNLKDCDQISKKIVNFLDNSQKYKTILAENVPNYVRKAWGAFEVVKELI